MSEHPVIALERELLTPECRSNARRLFEPIADDFVEIGASGRVWHKAEILEDLPLEYGRATPEFVFHELREIGSDHVLLIYSLRSGTLFSLRSSLWCLRESWQLVFHQGTLAGQ